MNFYPRFTIKLQSVRPLAAHCLLSICCDFRENSRYESHNFLFAFRIFLVTFGCSSVYDTRTSRDLPFVRPVTIIAGKAVLSMWAS